jgi:exodeoxyribonuclease VII large subunit
VRAAAESRIPLISAVGHETDWTLIDLVADARAPTPTKAAEWAVPKHSELSDQTAKCALRLGTSMRRTLENHRTHLKAAARGLPRRENLLELPRQRFDACDKRLGRALIANTRAHTLRLTKLTPRLQPRLLETRLQRTRDRLDNAGRRISDALSRGTSARRARFERLAGRLTPRPILARIDRAQERLASLDRSASQALINTVSHRRRALGGSAQLLNSLSYRSVLSRGYAVVRNASGVMVRAVTGVATGDLLDIELADGHINTKATEPGRPASPERSRPQAEPQTATPGSPRQTRRNNPNDQGSLF